jgi:hypothetical protein
MLWYDTDKDIPRYEKQMKNVDHLVLDTIRKKGVFIDKQELDLVLSALHEWRVIE